RSPYRSRRGRANPASNRAHGFPAARRRRLFHRSHRLAAEARTAHRTALPILSAHPHEGRNCLVAERRSRRCLGSPQPAHSLSPKNHPGCPTFAKLTWVFLSFLATDHPPMRTDNGLLLLGRLSLRPAIARPVLLRRLPGASQRQRILGHVFRNA